MSFEILNAFSPPIFILDPNAQILAHNDAGRALIETKHYFLKTGSKLSLVDDRLTGKWQETIRRTCVSAKKSKAIFGSFENDQPFQLITSIKATQNSAAMIWVVDGQKHNHERICLLSQHFEFTNREHQVFRGLIIGKSAADIAHELSLKINTIRTHTKHIYMKTNVRTQCELVAKFSTVSNVFL